MEFEEIPSPPLCHIVRGEVRPWRRGNSVCKKCFEKIEAVFNKGFDATTKKDTGKYKYGVFVLYNPNDFKNLSVSFLVEERHE